jgi:DNA-binding transcriptional MerR regulator
MRIGELAARTGASARSLRHYERHGLIRAERDANGYRRFAPETVRTVAKIRALLTVGLPVSAIRELLPCMDAEDRIEPCAGAVDTVRSRLARLEAEIDSLARQRAGLLGIVDGAGAP